MSYYSFLDYIVLYVDTFHCSALECSTLNCSVLKGIVHGWGTDYQTILNSALGPFPSTILQSYVCNVLYFDVLLCSTLVV